MLASFDCLLSLIVFALFMSMTLYQLNDTLALNQQRYTLVAALRNSHFLAFATQTDSHIFVNEHALLFENIAHSATVPIEKPCTASLNSAYLGFKSNFNSKKSGSITIHCNDFEHSIRLSPPYGLLKLY